MQENISTQVEHCSTVVHHGRSESGVDECGVFFTEIRGDSINSGHRWSKKRKLSTWIGTSKKKMPMRFDDGLCECRLYGRNREDLHHQA